MKTKETIIIAKLPIVHNQLRLCPGIANDALHTMSIWMADSKRDIADYLMTEAGGGDSMMGELSILIVSIDQQNSAYTAAEATGKLPQLNVPHEAIVNELGFT